MTDELSQVAGEPPIAAVPRPGEWKVKVAPPNPERGGHEMVGLEFVLIDPPVQGRRVLCMMERIEARELLSALARALSGDSP